jgi:nuclear transport factor 2 (NTF2) superfamily protein
MAGYRRREFDGAAAASRNTRIMRHDNNGPWMRCFNQDSREFVERRLMTLK